jgi:hypothetical protein
MRSPADPCTVTLSALRRDANLARSKLAPQNDQHPHDRFRLRSVETCSSRGITIVGTGRRGCGTVRSTQ